MKALWLYLAAGIVLLIGLFTMFRRGFTARGLDAIVEFGPLLFAIPMAVFGVFHFLFPAVVAPLVPKWIPAHLFWVYFVGVALITGAVSLATDKVATLAATLFGIMLMSFVLLISVPGVAAHPDNRFGWALILRDMSFSLAAFALALSRKQSAVAGSSGYLATALRSAIAVAMIFFAVEHFLHPQFVPVIPLPQRLPTWFPWPTLVNYVVGCALFIGGGCLLLNLRSRAAATWTGIMILAVVMLVYLPLLLATPSDVAQMNYFFDTLAYAGALLLIAALVAKPAAQTNLENSQPRPGPISVELRAQGYREDSPR